MPTSVLRTVVVDDEFVPSQHLEECIGQHCANVEVIANFQNPRDAYQYLLTEDVDLVFLDVEMPEMSGFELVELVGPEKMPSVIFTTAYSQYAVKAFKIRAVDYLLKPVDHHELRDAVSRFQNLSISNQQDLSPLIENPVKGFDNRLTLAERQSYHFVDFDEIVYVKGSGSYTDFYLTNDRHITTSKGLNIYAERLESKGFVKTHQSFMVNLVHVKEYQKNNGELLMLDQHQIPVSQRQKSDVMMALGLKKKVISF